jgi:acetolactate synthase I/II/III large subunit
MDVHELDALPDALVGALDVDGPSVISIECSADEIPPFAAFLGDAADAVSQPHIAEKEQRNVAARA